MDGLTDAQIKHMVDRFLSWRLPKPWNPDNGISYQRPNFAHAPADHDWPVGTNLLDAQQAEAMVRYLVDGMPAAAPQGAEGLVSSLEKLAKLATAEITTEDHQRNWKFLAPQVALKLCAALAAAPTPPTAAPAQDAATGGELKVCPFCGSKNAHAESDGQQFFPWFVHCPNGNCPASVAMARSETREQAIAAWNTRTPSPDARGLVERIDTAKEARLLMGVVLTADNARAVEAQIDDLIRRIAALPAVSEVRG